MELWEVAKILVEEDITGVPAVDDTGKLVGVVS
jgi:CBS domain-containing protein